jgi:hypothetical protein
MPAITVALGVKKSLVPKKWKGKRFDVSWIIQIPTKSKLNSLNSLESDNDDNDMKAGGSFKQLPQRLLYGDEDDLIDVKEGSSKPYEKDLEYNGVDDDDIDE